MDDLYGWRARIGLIYPAPGWVMEPEFYAMAPRGVAAYTTRISLQDVQAGELSNIGARSLEAVKLLAQAPLDVIALGCTSGSFINGPAYERQLSKDMTALAGGIPCITTSAAVCTALNYLHIKKLTVVTPYVDEVNDRARSYLEEKGLEIMQIRGLGLAYDSEIDRQDLETVYRFTGESDVKESEAVLILCTGLRSIPILDFLEQDLGKPVISAVQATFWNCLRIAGVQDKIRGFGSLLAV
ncbi:MAG: maleate cis-trans isomerase family protein [Peptococcaceae bacterium]